MSSPQKESCPPLLDRLAYSAMSSPLSGWLLSFYSYSFFSEMVLLGIESLYIILGKMLVPPTVIGRVEERIREAGPIDKISSLLLDEIPIGGFTQEIKELLEKCSKLEYLSLDTCGLSSLNLIPSLPKLEVLQLNNNTLTDDDLKVFGQFPKMRRIFMRENKIQKLDSLKELSQLEDLIQVELKENPICDSENYRESVYSIIKALEILDGKDKEGNEMEDLSNSEYSSENSESEKDMSEVEDSGEPGSSSNNAEDGDEMEDTGRKQRKLNPQ